MEFHIELSDAAPDVGAITEAILVLDPAALVDIDLTQGLLRVATSVDAVELASLVRGTGYPLDQDQVILMPSTCCGGCGG